MRWSKKKPTKEGWYWVGCPDQAKEIRCVKVKFIYHNKFKSLFTNEGYYLHESIYSYCYWFGPIIPPKEPECT